MIVGFSCYDIIGDIHGYGHELKALLLELGYSRHKLGYRHPDRKVVFVGDLVDGGPAIREVIEIGRAIVDAGDTLAVRHEPESSSAFVSSDHISHRQIAC